MVFTALPLKGAFQIEPEVKMDDRGQFYRFYCKREFAEVGIDKEWLHLNHSHTNNAGTIRGMHYQLPPFAETKLLRCINGKVYDVIIDLRHNSATYLQWLGTELSAENKKMLYIPEGFAHGFQTLTDHCELIYHHSAYYTPGAEGGIRFNDPAININWPLPVTQISDRDISHSLLDDKFRGIKI